MGDQKKGGRPKRSTLEVLCADGLASDWDLQPEIRDRLRDGGGLLGAEKVSESIPSAVAHRTVLQPLINRMCLLESKPLPAVDNLRSEIEQLYHLNKRGKTPEDQPDVVSIAWSIRKLLVFLKMKTRRHEVSHATLSH